MKGLDVLNAMALSDGEREFLDQDFSDEIDVSFESLEKAQEAFDYTSSIKSAIKVQAEDSNIPAAWTEMINAHPEQPVPLANEHRSVFTAFIASLKERRGAWSGGFVTACLVLVLVNPSDDIDAPADIGGTLVRGPLLSSSDNADKSMQPASDQSRADTPSEVPNLMNEIRQTQYDDCQARSGDDLDASEPPTDKDVCRGELKK